MIQTEAFLRPLRKVEGGCIIAMGHFYSYRKVSKFQVSISKIYVVPGVAASGIQ